MQRVLDLIHKYILDHAEYEVAYNKYMNYWVKLKNRCIQKYGLDWKEML